MIYKQPETYFELLELLTPIPKKDISMRDFWQMWASTKALDAKQQY